VASKARFSRRCREAAEKIRAADQCRLKLLVFIGVHRRCSEKSRISFERWIPHLLDGDPQMRIARGRCSSSTGGRQAMSGSSAAFQLWPALDA
jgi:hypothetical protein